ncbi:MAG TPA: hypothetical protein VK102_12160 [Sphingobacterium sp.]|nr:hypothetical protein [Sphingobacterium sp.]
MKKLNYIWIAVFVILWTSCNQKNNTDREQKQSPIQLEEKTGNTVSENSEDKFLISNHSAGYFKIGGSWQNYAEKEYSYKSVQGYGTCVDACCDGGFQLGYKIVEDSYGPKIENVQITIGAVNFDQNEKSESKYKDNPEVFYASSDNCKGWYWKDKINYIVVYSELFKTKEGIGVGTTLEEMQEKFGELHFYVGWIEEDINALQVSIKSYPDIKFILDIDAYKGNWEEIGFMEDKNEITVSDFKENSKIQRLIIRQIDKS